MEKKIIRIVLTGGPAAGKTTLVSQILKEFKQEDGWRVITIPETATDLISGFGIKPFGSCMSMLQFQDFVVADQLHKEKLALDAAQIVPEERILIVYDRALLDNKAYITDEEYAEVIRRFGLTEEQVISKYDVVLHLVTCAKGAEFAYNLGNAARTESIEHAREMDDGTLRCWSTHPNLKIIDNSVDFEDKMNRALREIYRSIGEPEPMQKKRKYLIEMPELDALAAHYGIAKLDMMQTYLMPTNPNVERRIRQQRNGPEYLYFYTEKHLRPDGSKWDTEKPISQKEYVQYLMESDLSLHGVHKTKYRFTYESRRFEIDVYPFSSERAVMIMLSDADGAPLPPEICVLRDVTGDSEYKNRRLAETQAL